MAEHRWDMTAHVEAAVCNLAIIVSGLMSKSKPKLMEPRQFNPFAKREPKEKKSIKEMAAVFQGQPIPVKR